MFNKKETEFTYFNEEWNEPTTSKDERGDFYDTDFNDGIDFYTPSKEKNQTIED